MPISVSSASKPSQEGKAKYDHAKHIQDLRTFRKSLGYELVHWYVHESAYRALVKAAQREDRKIQQYVSLNIWNLIPEDLRPKDIPLESLIVPKQKKVRLNLKIPVRKKP